MYFKIYLIQCWIDSIYLNEVEVVIVESSGIYLFSVDVSKEYTSLSKDVSFDEKLDEVLVVI